MRPFTEFELGEQDFERGENRALFGWGDDDQRRAGWDAAYRESVAKAAGGLRRIHAGRYESEDGMWSILNTAPKRWELVYGLAIGLRSQTTIDVFHTFAEAMDCLRRQVE